MLLCKKKSKIQAGRIDILEAGVENYKNDVKELYGEYVRLNREVKQIREIMQNVASSLQRGAGGGKNV